MVVSQKAATIVLAGHRQQNVAVVGDKLKSTALYRVIWEAYVCHTKIIGDKSGSCVIFLALKQR